MATAATYRERSNVSGRHARHSDHPSSYHDDDFAPDLVPSSSSSSGSSKSSLRHDLLRQMDEMEQYRQTHFSHGHSNSRSRSDGGPHHRSSSSRGSEQDMIMRGADIVRGQLTTAHNGTHRGGVGAGAAGKSGHGRSQSHDLDESKRILEEVDDLSNRLHRSAAFQRQEIRQAENTKTIGSDSSMTSSKYHYHFDPFADDVGDKDVPPPPPPPPTARGGPQVAGMYRAGREQCIKSKVDYGGDQRGYEPDFNDDDARRSHAYRGSGHYEKDYGYVQHKEQSQTHRGHSVQYDGPIEKAQSDYPHELRQSHPSNSRPRSSKEKAYDHAMRAGILWQTLVGEHVRFPKEWWGGARTPSLGNAHASTNPSKWWYISRHRVRGNEMLNSWVSNRTSAGQNLLHIVVSDSLMGPVQDIAIGCFHPNAKGIRRTTKAIADDENVREIWMAIRMREGVPMRDSHRPGGHDGLSVSLLNTALTLGHGIEDVGQPSPLGEKYSVTNENMRAVFGDKPPISTVDVPTSTLYKIIIDAVEEARFRGQAAPYPARTILQEFLFSKR
mmetsp:Transcript_45693/g.138841  ORF Transcript_45693/g.138841 Transcript_45693/m.138841 type:complete len:554 (-) Transcript_45693:371-2032(-)